MLSQSNRHRCGQNELAMRRRVAACRLLLSGDLGLSTQRCPTNRRCTSTARMRTVAALARTYSLRRAEHRGSRALSSTLVGFCSAFRALTQPEGLSGARRTRGGEHLLLQSLHGTSTYARAASDSAQCRCWIAGAKRPRRERCQKWIRASSPRSLPSCSR